MCDYNKFICGEPYNWYFICRICDENYVYRNKNKSECRLLQDLEHHFLTQKHEKNVFSHHLYPPAVN